MSTNDHTELARASDVAPPAELDQSYLRLWFALARRSWRSVVLVPGHVGGSAAEAARMLAEVGQKASGSPVKAIVMGSLDYGTALALADLQDQLRRLASELAPQPPPPQAEVECQVLATVPNWVPAAEMEAEEEPDLRHGPGGEWVWERLPQGADPGGAVIPPATARFVIAVPCPLSEQLSLSATQEADGVIIIVELGRTRKADIRSIVEQVGRERVVGCILMR